MNYIKNMIIFYAAFALNFLMGFILIKVLALYLPQDVLGQYFYISNLGLFAGGLLLLGFPLTLQRFIPIYIRDGKEPNASTLVHLPALLHFAVGLILSLPILLIKGTSFVSLFLAFYILNTITLYQTALIAQQKVLEYSLTSFSRILVIICLILLARPLLTLDILGIINLSINIVFFLILFSLFPLKLTSWHTVHAEIKPYWKYAILNQFLSPFFYYLDSILIPMFLPFSQLSLFQIGRKLDMGSRQTLEVPLQLTAPLISFKTQDELLTSDFAEKFRTFRLVYFYLALLWFLVFQFAGKRIILLISTPDYLSTYPYLIGLSFTLLLSTLYASDAMLARATGNIKLFFYKDIVWVAAFLMAFLLLTPKLGLNGTILSFGIATTATAVYHIHNYKVLHPIEYLFEFTKTVLAGTQAIIFISSKKFLPSIIILGVIIVLDFKNIQNAFRIVKKLRNS